MKVKQLSKSEWRITVENNLDEKLLMRLFNFADASGISAAWPPCTDKDLPTEVAPPEKTDGEDWKGHP